MSVQVNQYLGYGYLLPYNESIALLEAKYNEDEIISLLDSYNDSAYDTKIVEINGFSLISDGMSGKYNFFGKIFKKSAESELLKTTTMPEVSESLKDELSKEYKRIFGESLGVKAEIVLVTHYS